MKKRLLLHVCCAPCSIAIIDEIKDACDVTVFFYNPNIQPEAEYQKRKREVVRVCREWGIAMVDRDGDGGVWEREVGSLGPGAEGGPRCLACYRLRLAAAAAYARSRGFDLWATSLSSGRQKSSAAVNAVGAAVGRSAGAAFLAEDWKKGGRAEKSRRLVAERNIYRQDYCGCRYSLAAMVERRARAAAVK